MIEMDGGTIPDKNAMGENKFWVENNGLALKIFSEFCCDGCSCKSENNQALE